jgi:hypothetical protein
MTRTIERRDFLYDLVTAITGGYVAMAVFRGELRENCGSCRHSRLSSGELLGFEGRVLERPATQSPAIVGVSTNPDASAIPRGSTLRGSRATGLYVAKQTLHGKLFESIDELKGNLP